MVLIEVSKVRPDVATLSSDRVKPGMGLFENSGSVTERVTPPSQEQQQQQAGLELEELRLLRFYL